MKGLSWIVFVPFALLGGAIDFAEGKCSVAPLGGDKIPWNAYVCVQSSFGDLDAVPSDAEWIEFTVSHIRNLPPDAFARFRNLRRLTFYNCDLRDLSIDAFRGLENLEWLVLSNTEIGLARASLFKHLRNLKRLALDGAGLVYIEPEVFHHFRGLETLSLVDNDLDCLPTHALAPLVNLRTVHIGRNPWLCDCRNSLGKFFDDRSIAHGNTDGCIRRNSSYTSCTTTRVYECMATVEYPALPAPEAPLPEVELHNHNGFEWRDTVVTGIVDLERLPDESYWIQLYDVEIRTIPRYTFFRFGNTLRSIELDNCGIREIEREAFAGLHKLKRLILVGNGLTTIGNSWFRDLSRLQELILRRNAIETFEENSLAHLTELTTLDIRENRLTCLPDHYLRGLVSLRKLEATGNPWKCVCKNDLQNYLMRKMIGYDNISTRCGLPVPNYEFKWNSTRTGRMRWCWFSRINWPPVPRPTLAPTTTTPKPIYTPPTRPPRTGGCRVVHNPVNRTKIDICSCTGASLLDLVNVASTVESIKFSNSVISTIYNDAFCRFGRNLRHLEFRECSIHRIDSRAFNCLWNLETLVIRGNYLMVVESAWFDHITHLRTLDLGNNRITRIEYNVFHKLPHLQRLDVSGNLMNCIGTEHLEALKNLRELEVTENPWTCLCARKLVEIFKNRRITCNCNPNVLIQKNEGGWGCGHDEFTTFSPTWSQPPTHLPPQTPTQPSTQPWPQPPTQPWSQSPNTTIPAPSSQIQPSTTVGPPTNPPWPPTGTCIVSNDTNGGKLWYRCANGDISVLLHIPSYITKIEIRDSYIPNLPAWIFRRFENLTDLVLINCTLTNIDQGAFYGLTRLERLTMRHNRFTIVKNGWFNETKQIIAINLSDNDLSGIETGSLAGLNYLEYLNLEGNAFRCIYTNCFVGLPRLTTVEFGRNRLMSWRCWEEIQAFLLARGISYTNYNCPHNGKEVVKNWFKDNTQAQPMTAGSDSIGFHSVIILALCSIAMRFYV